MEKRQGYWKVFVLMGIGYLLHFAPDSWQNACCRGVVKLPLLGKALLLVVLIYLVIQIKSSDTVSYTHLLILVPVLYCSFAGTGIKRNRKKMKAAREDRKSVV